MHLNHALDSFLDVTEFPDSKSIILRVKVLFSFGTSAGWLTK